MKTKKVILNLGSGKTRIPGVLNVDLVDIKGYTDIVHNLDQTPYPFKTASVDEVHLYHLLEHLNDPLKKIEEIHRILKPGGVLHLRVPHFSSMGAFTDITHKRPFGYFSFDCFEPDSYHHFYTQARFRITHKSIKYFGLYPNEGFYEKYIHHNTCPLLVRPLVRLINFFISLSPSFFERVWCYWVGGATEVVIDMQKEK